MNNIHVHIPFNKINEHLEQIKDYQLDLEIYFTSPLLDVIQKDDIKKMLKSLDYSPSLSIHAPFMDLSPGAIDSKVRSVTIERFMHIIDIAEMLSATHVVFHSGYEKWTYNHKIDTWLEKSLLTWERIIKYSQHLDVKLAIENIFEDEPTNLSLLMERLHSERFGICFDTGHFNIFTNRSLSEWMDALKPYILELHLHDNIKTADSHFPIGDGSFDFHHLFSLLGDKECLYTIETHSPEMVIKSIERLRSLK